MGFWEVMEKTPEISRAFLAGCFIILGLIIFIIALKMGWIKGFRASFKNGMSVDGQDKKAIEKKYESGNLHNIMNQQIHKADIEMLEFALARSNNIRRGLAKQLNTKVFCVSSRRALAACLRYPLNEAAVRNNFKYTLRPENAKFYIDRLMKEISDDYEEYSIEVDNNTCPIDLKQKCKPLPPLEEVFEGVRQQIIDYWALPIRMEQIKMHWKKIETYQQFVVLFEQLGDLVMVKVCENCIDKNRGYIDSLKRRPEPNEL